MKVCYFIQSHKNPEQVIRLVTTIKKSSPDCHIIISHDFSSSYLEQNVLTDFTNIYIIRRNKPARRGDSSILDICLQTIDYIFEHQIEFDWLISLSGQDYPIQPVYKFEDFLKKTQDDCFLNYYDARDYKNPINKRQDSIKRYTSQYISLPYWCKPFLNQLSKIEKFIPFLRVQSFFSMLGIKAWSTPFNDDFIAYSGYYWFTLSKECVIYFRNFIKTHPKLLKYYQRTLAPEESMIATVLVNSGKFKVADNTLQYVDFPKNLRGFAANIQAKDLSRLVQQNYFFARKFALEQDPEIFDLIDQKILTVPTK
ncbi:core-2/I-branching enzyme [Aphanothece hegewaldii CCALA 016]|uniref:Peptide O-xylosyltransferase n=1 Tax=Aphanothece hegewaldii CCALA 016 TaxID=2107694 RepID=A0A2T1M1Q7_9CHRO|nr:beta-1,6-N-acetylglucosaminyltransferase [Aphanothece hegewaldii]PSF38654.1 core-2/I-branching enzyme [Aphanothece hegewaldii CCALA 016]